MCKGIHRSFHHVSSYLVILLFDPLPLFAPQTVLEGRGCVGEGGGLCWLMGRGARDDYSLQTADLFERGCLIFFEIGCEAHCHVVIFKHPPSRRPYEPGPPDYALSPALSLSRSLSFPACLTVWLTCWQASKVGEEDTK